MKSCKIEPNNIKEDHNKAPTSSVNIVITNLEDLDPRVDSEDQWPTLIEDGLCFQIGKEFDQCTKIGMRMEDAVRKR